MALEFGIFDHVDRHDLPLKDFYEDRLKLIEAYDRAGIFGYHCAEHHSTPLGMAPSPSVYLAAIAQRTKELHFGPLVYTLALYHPLRLAEEICMLDQMSRGRFLLGIGKGISPIEVGYYGIDYKNADKMFGESFAVIRQALTQKTVDFEGEFFRFKNVPMELAPFRQPHPPLWYGVVNPDSAERAAKAGMNFISNSTATLVKAKVARYSAAYQAKTGQDKTRTEAPKFGMNRYMVLADTEEKALEIGRRAYKRWWSSFMALWHKHGIPPTNVNYPPEIDGQIADGRAIVGTPAKALELLRAQLAESGANYLVCRFAFGDLTLSESLRTVELFQRDVIPGLRESVAVAAE
jgi:alkanesulfonate monooxygenase SsuD/methylene tetrahydromethanopterin reductase-like flavin-dependent oxidoreductase (luciferase family)